MFVAPAFLYRIEQPAKAARQGPVNDWELATRLSYFLWSSLPDDELRRLAAAGQLRNSETLVAQTRRMLRDPKIRRLATEFACQWLLKTAVPISRLRGRLGDYNGIQVMPTWHPAYLLRNPGAKKDVWEDMKVVIELLKS